MSDGLLAMCLCFLLRDSATGTRQVLLGEKLRGLGTGRVVGLGGHIEAGETAVQAAIAKSPRSPACAGRMRDDARHWLPRVLAGEQLGAGFTFAADLRTVLPERIVFSPLPTLATPGQSPASTDT